MVLRIVNNMKKIKVIKTEKDYKEALELVEELLSRNPDPDSAEGEQLNLQTILVQDYEAKVVPDTLPDPIEAIKFRMEQADIKPTDLVPFIGSKSRVSEILSRKRLLTLDMVRALTEGLGIPEKVLIQKYELNYNSEYENWDKGLVKKMRERDYFGAASQVTDNITDLLKDFFSVIGSPANAVGFTRKSIYRSSPRTDRKALVAWATRIIHKAKEIEVTERYQHNIIDLDFMRGLAKFSLEDDGPLKAREHLKKFGIILIIEPHLPKTYLDGATILINKDNPIIGLTLRHDRLDNFWFTLMHELAHIALHYDSNVDCFFDEIEGLKAMDLDDKEREADEMAEEALLPKAKWEISPARLIPSAMAANSLALELGIHIAVVAGQIRHRLKKYIYLSKIVNEAKVKKYFPSEKWDK